MFEIVARRLGTELIGFYELEGGSSADVWRIDLVDEGGPRSVVFRHHEPGELKQHCPDVVTKEYHVLRELHALGFPVAMPLLREDTDQWLVTEFVVGDSIVDPADLSSALSQMANLLSRLHSVDANTLDIVELTAGEDPIERLSTCLPETAAGRTVRTLIDQGTIGLHHNPRVLIHGDYWPGNVLWHGGRLAAVIDWEDAWLGDPLADLACARVELLCQYDEAAMHAFTNLYLDRASPLDTRSLPVWECYVSATAIASMHLWGLDPAEESRRRKLTTSFFDRAASEIRPIVEPPR